jgi:hypothetical protein
MRTVVSNRRDVFTQFPKAVESCSTEISYQLEMREEGVQVPASSRASTDGNTYELAGGVLSDSTASGKINVFKQTRAKSVTEEGSQRTEKISKNLAKTSKYNEFSKASVKCPDLNESPPLCCCECRKLLREISSSIRSTKQRSFVNSVGGCVKGNNLVDVQKYDPSSGRITQSKNKDKSFSGTCTTPSSGTSGDAIELTRDLDHVKTSVTAEAVENTGVQSAQPNSLPSIRPQRYPAVPQGTGKVSGKAENSTDASLKRCPCCGASEDQMDTILVSPHETASEWKCRICLKGREVKRHVWKCQVCGVLQSALLISQSNGFPDCDTKLLDEGKLMFNKGLQCGLQEDCYDVEEKEGDSGTTSSSTNAVKAAVGYVITIETSADSASSFGEKSEEKPLEEIRIKIPKKKIQSASSRGRENEKLSCVSESSMKSSKQKQNPIGGTENKSSTEGAVKRNSHYSSGHTLQVNIKDRSMKGSASLERILLL